MKQYWSSKALSDLDGIRDHSLQHWGRRQTADYLRLIRNAIQAAARAPMQAASASHYRPGYRKLSAGVHLIFFRVGDDAIEIIRILHQRMDVDSKLD